MYAVIQTVARLMYVWISRQRGNHFDHTTQTVFLFVLFKWFGSRNCSFSIFRNEVHEQLGIVNENKKLERHEAPENGERKGGGGGRKALFWELERRELFVHSLPQTTGSYSPSWICCLKLYMYTRLTKDTQAPRWRSVFKKCRSLCFSSNHFPVTSANVFQIEAFFLLVHVDKMIACVLKKGKR